MELKKIFLKKSMVAVEVGADWFKVMESVPSPLGVFIRKAGFLKFSQIKEPVSDAIARLFADLKLDGKNIIACIPQYLVTIKFLELPSINAGEVTDMINLQAGKQTPYSKEEIIFDHKIVNTQKEGYSRVVLAIARRTFISERVEILEKAGIQVKKVLLSTSGLYGWFYAAYLSADSDFRLKTTVFLDIDSNYSDFMVVHQGNMFFSRNIFIGANQLSQGNDEWRDKFTDEVKLSTELFQREYRIDRISKLFLSGAGKDIAQSLSIKLDMPAQTTDYSGIQMSSSIGSLIKENSKFFSICALLGILAKENVHGIDLTPPELRICNLMDDRRKKLTLTGMLLASIVIMASLVLMTNIYNRTAYLNNLRERMSEIGKDTGEIEKMRKAINFSIKRMDSRGTTLDIMAYIYSLTPGEIFFTDINVEEKKQVILRGKAAAMSQVLKFVSTLENSPVFSNVKNTYTTSRKDKDSEYMEFEIACGYKKR